MINGPRWLATKVSALKPSARSYYFFLEFVIDIVNTNLLNNKNRQKTSENCEYIKL